MSIEVIYQGLTIAKGAGFRLQDGGVFVELDGPMPVATPLSLTHGEHALRGRVRRVSEGTGAGMLIVPTETQKLPRWLLALGPKSIANVELEPEPAPIAVEVKPTPAPAAELKPAEAGASAEAGHEAGEPAAASGHTPSEHGEGAKDDDGDDKSGAKAADKSTHGAAANAKKKKPRKR